MLKSLVFTFSISSSFSISSDFSLSFCLFISDFAAIPAPMLLKDTNMTNIARPAPINIKSKSIS
jgi:hypothetical protein